MRLCVAGLVGVLILAAGPTSALIATDEAANNIVSLLAAGKPVLGVYTGGLSSPRIAKVLATSDADFIVADVEHGIYDFLALHSFLLEMADFHHRYRTQPRAAPGVLVKLGHRGGWDPRYEISEVMRVGPAVGVWVPIVERGLLRLAECRDDALHLRAALDDRHPHAHGRRCSASS